MNMRSPDTLTCDLWLGELGLIEEAHDGRPFRSRDAIDRFVAWCNEPVPGSIDGGTA